MDFAGRTGTRERQARGGEPPGCGTLASNVFERLRHDIL